MLWMACETISAPKFEKGERMPAAKLSAGSLLAVGAAVTVATVVGGYYMLGSGDGPGPDYHASDFLESDDATGIVINDIEPVCPEGVKDWQAAVDYPDSCGRDRPPPSLEPRPIDGVWEVYSPGNPKVAALTIFINTHEGALHREDPNRQSPAQGVWQLNGWANYSDTVFSLPLNIADDGSIAIAHGQFEFCNCVQMHWTVSPTGDPNVMSGIWRYQKKQGTTTWRRRAAKTVIRSVTVSNARYDEAGKRIADTFLYGERSAVLERNRPVSCQGARGNCERIVISVLGDNFAGAHNVWIDPASHLDLDSAGWICRDGSFVTSNWDRCGVGRIPGENVTGIHLSLLLRDGMAPGPRNFWVNGAPIPIDVAIEGFPVDPNTGKPELISIEAYDAEINQLDAITPGQPFFLVAAFEEVHPDPWIKVEVPVAETATVTNMAGQESRDVTLQRQRRDKRVFKSDYLVVRPRISTSPE